MKNRLLLFVVFAFIASPVFGQFYFSASPGLNLNGASFGYKVGKIVPYVGFQMMNAKFTLETNEFDWTTPGTLDEHNMKTEVKANLFIPTIGAKYFIIENNKLKAFVGLGLTKPIIKAKMDFTYDGDAVNEDFKEEVEDAVDNVKMFGGELGFGVEYFFDDNFSVGGEFGLRYLKTKYTQDTQGSEWNGNDYEDVTNKTEVNLNLMPTYTKISLNFYFGGGEK
jgi:hypothetical protein